MSTMAPTNKEPSPDPPRWVLELIALYESNATNQFILYGNVDDRLVLPLGRKARMGTLSDLLLRVLMPRFDVILSYDLGNGISIEQGGEQFSQWPHIKANPQLPKPPRTAIELATHYFRYCANLHRLGGQALQIGFFVRAAQLVIPNLDGGFSYELNAIASLIRSWTTDTLLTRHPLVTFLITENLNDLHSLLVNNPRTAHIKIPLPSTAELTHAMELLAEEHKTALNRPDQGYEAYARQLAGATLSSVESLIKVREHSRQELKGDDLVGLKKRLVEKECNGLIEFVESKRTLDDLYGQEKIKAWLRQDISLLRQNDLEALPMGYLFCGPVGTGKTFMVECLAGEAELPVVKLKNFRDRWVGSTEGNLEKIFRLLHALGRCFVFIDEADQALGKRDSGMGDSNLSGRIYAMIAQEMSDTKNRGKIIWILATSRPDLIEVDLKRPGRVDVKIPLFPTGTAAEGFQLISALCRKRGMTIDAAHFASMESLIPPMMTPGAAEALAVKVYRRVRTELREPVDVLRECLTGYQNPVPQDVMDFQIRLAVKEATDREFIPTFFQER